MPPAFVLSQNQTLKLMYDRTPAGMSESKTGISGSRSCTKITIWCVCVFETYELLAETEASARIHKERHKFDRSADTQRLSVTGPPPTCPFIKTDNVKEPTRFLPRFDWFRESVVPTKKRHETNARPHEEAASVAVGAIYVWA